MKRLHFALGLLMIPAFSGLQAQSLNLRATIPFDFRMEQTLMPAGDYRITHSNGVLILRPQDGSKAVIGLTSATALPKNSSEAGLLFHRYGDTYFLYKVWTPGYGTARGISESPLEKELARAGVPEQDQNLVLQTK